MLEAGASSGLFEKPFARIDLYVLYYYTLLYTVLSVHLHCTLPMTYRTIHTSRATDTRIHNNIYPYPVYRRLKHRILHMYSSTYTHASTVMYPMHARPADIRILARQELQQITVKNKIK